MSVRVDDVQQKLCGSSRRIGIGKSDTDSADDEAESHPNLV